MRWNAQQQFVPLTLVALVFATGAAAGQTKQPVRPRAGASRPAPVKPATKAPSDLNLVAALEARMASAEQALKDEEPQIAESRYHDALLEGWMLIGALEISEGKLPQARDAFRRATQSAVDSRLARQSLALVSLQTGDTAEAVQLFTELTARAPKDGALRRLLAQALVADGQTDRAVQSLEEARTVLPGDLELTFMLGSGYLRQKKPDAAAKIFAEIAAAKPIPETDVLIGRTYRDFREFARAREALGRALKKNPRVRRAHYYLGTIAIMEEGFAKLEEAAREFQQELVVSPGDPVTSLRLGIVLEEAKRHEEALPHLELAARQPGAQSEAFEYLGRCQVALRQPQEAATTLQRALDLSKDTSIEASRIGRLHYQLGNALRALGRDDEAAAHFAQAERSSEARADNSRERLARYLADVPDPDAPATAAPTLSSLGPVPFAEVSSADRATVRKRVTDALARAYLNLGVMQARANQFARAAACFDHAAGVSPDFPQVQYSLAIAYFNAKQYDKAVGPLERATAEDPSNGDLRRMLAIAFLNVEQFDKAAQILAEDPGRASDPSLEYAYGLALVRSGHADEAQRVFGKLLAEHGDSPELNVVLGQAYAQQGDNEQAIATLKRALAARADVAEANTTLGIIYLKQGQLDDAERALQTELRAHPEDVRARHTLAAVFDLQNRPDDAVRELRTVLKARPGMADSRYLLGKILLAQGHADDATSELEAAAKLSPDDANIHFQLAQAYQKTGRTELAQQEFERYRQLKDKKREGAK
jgi:tetratricopeptide (TPR) repeat protein